ncbi:EAL domain-containing protein [Nocardioides sp. LHG3406-4]|uniref:EAL domain-containing protein n=1 Tax=Nocardioides sp. LHG3406-4 TaxID=2804575 RepID=UPI003CFB6365
MGSPRIEPARPTARTAVPFAVVAALGIGSAFLPPYADGSGPPWLMLLAFGIVIALVAVSIRRPVRTWVDPAAPLVFFAVVALARDMTGGSTSGLAPLVAVPILWLALTGTRRDIVVAGVLTAAVFLVPLLALGEPEYSLSDWRRAALWSAVALLVAPVVQRVVEQLARESLRARTVSAELADIMRGARLSSMISTDLSGTIRSFSAGSEELLGYDAASVVGLHDPGLFHDPEEVAAVATELGVEPGFAVFAELARLRAPSRIWTYVRADGERIYVQLAITDVRDADGVTTGYLGVAIDVTAGVEARHSLERSESRWRVLLDNLPDITVIVVDEELRVRVVAGAGENVRESEGRLLGEVAGSENMFVLEDLISQAFAGEESTVQVGGTGTGSELEIVVAPLPPEVGGARALILARNVSKERARERAVVEAMERAERLFADAPHGVAVLTTDGVVLRVNAAMSSIVGDVPEGLVGHPLARLSRPGNEDLEVHLNRALADPGVLVETDWTLRAATGNEVDVFLSSRVLPGAEGGEDLVLVNVVDVSERRRYERRLAHLADHDVLTGLANRRRFDEELARHLEHCDRYGPTGALLLLDLDNFKDVNDTLGHGVGDQLIISTAALLQRGVRSTDIVARLGGDEFAILLPDADLAAAEVVAKSIVERVREYTATLDGTRRRVTASVGVVTIRAANEHAADVLALADMTMYDAKDAGRDGYAVLDEETFRQPRTGARLQWKGRIEQALENDDFALYLQPILDLHSNKIHSAEVLLRLCDTDEVVLPGRFLYIAERAGLAPSVDSWVIDKSVAMLARLRQVAPEFQLEVNLSGHSIGNPVIETAICQALARHSVVPSALILEITETAAVADVEIARQFAERMTALGCRFALDDFGAGFGSFYYLKHLQFDYVKIDGEFVAGSHRSGIDRTIMRSIVGIAHDLGKQTVAEFVGEQAVLDVVRAQGVDLAQGYLIGEPMPYDAFVAACLTGPQARTPAFLRDLADKEVV